MKGRGYWFVVVAVVVVSLLVTCVGCSDNTVAEFNPPGQMKYEAGASYAREFRLLDGTRCVVYAGSAITCEWKQPVVLMSRPQ